MSANKDLNRLKVVLVEKKNQSLAIQTTGMCANNGIEMVYQRLSASDGDVSTNSEVVGGRIERISE